MAPSPLDLRASRASGSEVEAWVWDYFGFMDSHGAFILSAQSGPADEAVGAASSRMHMRVAWLLGMHLRGRQRTPRPGPLQRDAARDRHTGAGREGAGRATRPDLAE